MQLEEHHTQISPQNQLRQHWLRPLSIHQALCCPTFLMVFRHIACILLGIRLYFNIADFYRSFLKRIFTALLYFVLVIQDYWFNLNRQLKLSPRLKAIINFLFEISFCLALPISAGYWIVMGPERQQAAIYTISDIGNHGLPLGCLLIDFIFNIYQFPCRHLLFIFLISVVYMFINLGYSLTVRSIYPQIDWRSFKSYAFVIATLAAIICTHIGSALIYSLCKKNRIEEITRNHNPENAQ